MKKSREKSQETASYANKAQSALNSIKKSVAEIKGKNMQMATAVEEQTMVAVEIHRNITNISQVTEVKVSSIIYVEKSSRQPANY